MFRISSDELSVQESSPAEAWRCLLRLIEAARAAEYPAASQIVPAVARFNKLFGLSDGLFAVALCRDTLVGNSLPSLPSPISASVCVQWCDGLSRGSRAPQTASTMHLQARQARTILMTMPRYVCLMDVVNCQACDLPTHAQTLQETVPVPPVNPSGCARAEPFSAVRRANKKKAMAASSVGLGPMAV